MAKPVTTPWTCFSMMLKKSASLSSARRARLAGQAQSKFEVRGSKFRKPRTSNPEPSPVPPVLLGYPAGVLFCYVTHEPSRVCRHRLRILSSIDHNVTSGLPYRALAVGRTSPDDTSNAD